MTMRVVIVHNRYRSANPSGENRVVESDIEQLRADGVAVIPYIRDSDEIEGFTALGKAGVAVRPLVSPADALAFRRLLREVQPHIVHLHNPYPLISPWIVRTAKAQRVPVVQTVHNYRHVCVNGIHFRDGHLCTECVGKTLPWPAVAHGCYQGSRARSVPMAASLVAHRSTWDLVDRFLPVGEAVADHLRALGIPDERIEVRPNVVDDPGPPAPLGEGVLFVGRLSPEKGIELLLDAWRTSALGANHTLKIAGDGELRPLVEAAAQADPSIRYLGFLGKEELDTAFRQCALVVVPSTCREADPVAVASALAHGRPVLATDLGAMATSVDDEIGWRAAPNARELGAVLGMALSDLDQLTKRALIARARYENLRRARSDDSLVVTYRRLLGVPRGSVLVVGPDGAGKSAVVDDLAVRANDAGVPLERAHFRPGVLLARPEGDGGPVTDPHAQTPRGLLPAAMRTAVVWLDFFAGCWGPWRRAARQGLLVLERPWFDQAVDPIRYRLPTSLAKVVEVAGRVLPRPDVAVLLAGEPRQIHERKPEIGEAEVERQLRTWRRLLPAAGRRFATVNSVGVPLAQTVDGVIEAASPPASIDRPRRWVRPLGFPSRIDMHVTSAPFAAAALAVYPPQRRSAAVTSRLGTSLARAQVAGRASAPPVPLDRIADKLGLAIDGCAAMRSSATDRWVVGAERAGRLAWVLKVGPEDDAALANEADYLEVLADVSTTWRVPRLVGSGVVDGWRFVATEAIISPRPTRRPTMDDVVLIVNDLVSGRATGLPLVHGDLAPWNLMWAPDQRWVVLDWESARAECRPLWDLAHYIVQQGVLLGRPDEQLAAELLTGALSPGESHRVAVDAQQSGSELVIRYLNESVLPDHQRAADYRERLRGLLP